MQGNLAEVVEGFGLVGTGSVEVALEKLLGVVELVNFVVLNAILVALALGLSSDGGSCDKQGSE